MTYKYYNVEFKLNKKNTLNFINSIFLVNGRITDSDDFGMDLYPDAKNIGQCWVLVRVAIPEGKENLFEVRSGLELKEPPKVVFG